MEKLIFHSRQLIEHIQLTGMQLLTSYLRKELFHFMTINWSQALYIAFQFRDLFRNYTYI